MDPSRELSDLFLLGLAESPTGHLFYLVRGTLQRTLGNKEQYVMRVMLRLALPSIFYWVVLVWVFLFRCSFLHRSFFLLVPFLNTSTSSNTPLVT